MRPNLQSEAFSRGKLQQPTKSPLHHKPGHVKADASCVVLQRMHQHKVERKPSKMITVTVVTHKNTADLTESPGRHCSPKYLCPINISCPRPHVEQLLENFLWWKQRITRTSRDPWRQSVPLPPNLAGEPVLPRPRFKPGRCGTHPTASVLNLVSATKVQYLANVKLYRISLLIRLFSKFFLVRRDSPRFSAV